MRGKFITSFNRKFGLSKIIMDETVVVQFGLKASKYRNRLTRERLVIFLSDDRNKALKVSPGLQVQYVDVSWVEDLLEITDEEKWLLKNMSKGGILVEEALRKIQEGLDISIY